MGRMLGRNVVWLTACALTFGACAASETSTSELTPPPVEEEEDDDDGVFCVPGHQTDCACPGDAPDGIQVCKDDGSGYDKCDCELPDPGPQEPCGDNVCDEDDDENCHTCPDDCGPCEPCLEAPSCEGAQIPPVELAHLMEFDVPKMDWVPPAQIRQRLVDAVQQAGLGMRLVAAALDPHELSDEHPVVARLRAAFAAHPEATRAVRRQLIASGMVDEVEYRHTFPEPRVTPATVLYPMDVEYPGGTVECGAPMLRIGVSKIKVHEEDDDLANDIVYCVVQAEATTGSEIRVTPKTPNLDEGEEHVFGLEAGVFWGQLEPTTPGGNLLLTYDCIEADSSDGYQSLIDSIGAAALGLGTVVPGQAGWVLLGIGLVAPIVSGGLALDSDDQLFNAQQTIPLDRQLEMTNGAKWTVRREGTNGLSDWDWELFIHAWGCAEYGEADQQGPPAEEPE